MQKTLYFVETKAFSLNLFPRITDALFVPLRQNASIFFVKLFLFQNEEERIDYSKRCAIKLRMDKNFTGSLSVKEQVQKLHADNILIYLFCILP